MLKNRRQLSTPGGLNMFSSGELPLGMITNQFQQSVQNWMDYQQSTYQFYDVTESAV